MTVIEREEKRRLTKIKELTYFSEARKRFFDRKYVIKNTKA